MKRLQKWKTALEKAADLSGHAFNLDGKEYEYDFIGKIVDFVSKKINRTPLYVQDCRVGLKPRVLQVKSLLNMESDDGVCMVGIHGMGGIGKTTLAREIYNSIANHFEASCFLDDVRQNSLQNLQETLLHRTIREKDIKLGSVNDGMSVIRQRLQTKKVLLILDNVDDLKQLAALVGRRDWFGPGSRIINTTRDLDLLKRHGIEKTYEVRELDMDEALELLSWKAFGNNKVDPSYKDILNRAITCTSGLPLALEVVGSNLFGKKIEEWEPILARYKRNPCKDIQKTLSVSFDALEKDEQGIYLDIACCFNNSVLEGIERVLSAHYGYCIKYLIKLLVEKSLIKVDQWSNYVRLHDLIEDMGKEIVRQESPKEPGKRSRLWSQKDIVTVLEDNTGTGNIEIIYLDSSSSCKVDWDGEAFKKMRNLKTLIIGNRNKHFFAEDPKHFPSSLRVLELVRYSTSKFIPSIFSSKKFENMTILKSDYNEHLTNIPDVSGLPNLEILSFSCCCSLTTIHESVGFLSKLKILDVVSCLELRSFPPIIRLPSLQVLGLSKCRSLESFPEISEEMKNITQLDLDGTSIKELPSSFQNLTGLCKLTVERAKLPISILHIPKLSMMNASDCQLLPIQNDNLSSVESSNVKFLHLHNCNLTDEILSIVVKLVANVEVFNLSLMNTSIQELPSPFQNFTGLCKLTIERVKLPISILYIPKLSVMNASDCQLLPEQNDNLSSGTEIILLHWYSNVKFLTLHNCNLTDKILSIVVKLGVNLRELDLQGSNFTTIPECITECSSLSHVNLNNCKSLVEIRGVPPNLICLSAMGCESLTSSGLVMLNQNLGIGSESLISSCFVMTTQEVAEDFLSRKKKKEDTEFCVPPEWGGRLDHIDRFKRFGRLSVSFWFRKSIPYPVFVYFRCKLATGSEWGGRYNIKLAIPSSGWTLDYTEQDHQFPLNKELKENYMYQLEVKLKGLESELKELLLKNEWIHAQVWLEDDDAQSMEISGWDLGPFVIGDRVIMMEETSMESMDDIRFTDPYEEREN